MYKELVEYIVKSLVERPEDVEVRETEEQGTIVLEVSVASDDAGRVIGKSGRVVNAIRTLLQAHANRTDKRVSLEIM